MTSASQQAPMAPETVLPPRISHGRAAVVVVLAMTVAGVVGGAVWAWLAPPIAAAIGLNRSGERVHGYVGDGADHVFLGAFLLPGIVSVVAVVAAVWVWRWRAHRGPLAVGALTAGALAASAAAAGVGTVLAHWRYGSIDIASAPVSPENRVFYLTEAPAVFFGHEPLTVALTIVFPAGMAALVYALCVLSAQRDDLGAWPPVEPPPGQRLAGPTGPAPTAGAAPPADPASPSR